MSAAMMTGLRRPGSAPRLARIMARAAAAFVLLLPAGFLALAPLRWAFAGAVGAALGISLLIEPALALFLLAAAIPWSNAIALPVPGVGAADLLVGLTAALWLAQGVVRRRIVLRWPPLSVSLLLFVWIAALSLTQAFSWRDGLPEWLKWAEFAVLYIVAGQLLTPRSVKWVLVGLFTGGLSQVALGAYQFIRQVGPDAFILPGGFMRAYGSFNQPNPYAGYLGYLTPIAASLALWAAGRWWQRRRRQDLVLTAVLTAMTGALLAGIVMSWSRGGWLGLAGAFVVVAALRNWRTAAATVGVMVILALALTFLGTSWLPGALAGRVQDLSGYINPPDPARTEITDANFSVLERLAHWRAGAWMFADHPWLGVGIGNYGAAYGSYRQPYFYDPLGHAHNVFINFAAETGLLGLGGFLAFWLGVGWLTLRRGWSRPGWSAALSIGVLGTWTYLTIHGQFDNLFVQHMQLQLALLLAALTIPAPAAPDLLLNGSIDGSRTTFRINHDE